MSKSRKAKLLIVFRLTLFVLVLAGIGWAVAKAFREMQSHAFDWSEVDAGGFLLACLCYILGMLPCWLYWHQTLRVMGQRPTRFESFRAFLIGQLGKYVPGKATVVALRADWVRSDRTNVAPAAASVFIETLTMMAVGAWIACSYLLFAGELPVSNQLLSRTTLVVLSVILMMVAGIPIWPPVFRRLVKILGVKKADPEIDKAIAGIGGRLLFQGWALNLVSWACWGLSLLLIVRSLPGTSADLNQWPLMTATVALAMVAGFLSLLPGGIGIRELIILTLLNPWGATTAVIAALVLRMAWLVSEVTLATILYLGRFAERPARSS